MIRAAGFHNVDVHVDELDLRFNDALEWWHWVWSHGFRQVLEQLAADQLATYQETAFERIGHQGIAGRMQALIAVAGRHEP